VPDVEDAKHELRRGVLAGRGGRLADDLAAARAAIRSHVLTRCAAEGWRCVAGYEPLRTEPGSVELLSELAAAGVLVLVPRTLPSRDLDWASWPSAEVLGVDAVGQADAVLVPALAVARDGTRLGRGGGSYDRALPRCAPGVPIAALLFADELVEQLPRAVWDRPVTAVVTPSGWVDL
jgi:5-formyltetrahydrofolate cyclo-ligase